MTTIPDDTLRQATRLMADWLEHRRFAATLLPGQDPEIAKLCAASWAEGYRRAIFELRWAAREPMQVPDDISGLDP